MFANTRLKATSAWHFMANLIWGSADTVFGLRRRNLFQEILRDILWVGAIYFVFQCFYMLMDLGQKVLQVLRNWLNIGGSHPHDLASYLPWELIRVLVTITDIGTMLMAMAMVLTSIANFIVESHWAAKSSREGEQR